MLIMNAEVAGHAGRCVRADAEKIVEVGASLRAWPGERLFDARGGAVIPGLHDHHVHLRAELAARSSIPVGPPSVRDSDDFARALRTGDANGRADDWLRAVGYHESVAGHLDRDRLDAIVSGRPVRVQHRTGALWILNSRAVELTGLDSCQQPGVERVDGRVTGRLWRMDAWLRGAVTRRGEAASGDVASGDAADGEDRAAWRALSSEAARWGVTGFTDATPDRSQQDVDAFAALRAEGAIRQRLVLMSPAHLMARPGIGLGPHKIMLDDRTLPDSADLAETVRAVHEAGSPVALHCVTADQLVIATDAVGRAGCRPGDRIEHGSVIPPGFEATLRALGVTVVTQPGFVAERGDVYRREVAAEEQPWLYRCATLRRAGVPVAGGTDAPYSSPDVWRSVRAAIDRTTPSGQVLNPGERLSPPDALGLFLGHPDRPGELRRIAVGQPGDLCVLRAPLGIALREPSSEVVAATVIGGHLVTGD
jgi:predicted amidohydrolase YtcJ